VKSRRGAVKLDGYNSENSEDEEEENEEMDMFADEKPERKSKEPKYLQDYEIEGQIWTSTEQTNEGGIPIEPFNMKEDLEEGYERYKIE